jgi:hypothetical protein
MSKIKLCSKHHYPLNETVDGEMVCDKCIQKFEETIISLSLQKIMYNQQSNGEHLANKGTTTSQFY